MNELKLKSAILIKMFYFCTNFQEYLEAEKKFFLLKSTQIVIFKQSFFFIWFEVNRDILYFNRMKGVSNVHEKRGLK